MIANLGKENGGRIYISDACFMPMSQTRCSKYDPNGLKRVNSWGFFRLFLKNTQSP